MNALRNGPHQATIGHSDDGNNCSPPTDGANPSLAHLTDIRRAVLLAYVNDSKDPHSGQRRGSLARTHLLLER